MKRLYRSKKQRILGGVCGGIANHLDVDVTLVRLLWVLALLVGGAALIAYIVAWIIIPEEPGESTAGHQRNTAPPTKQVESETDDGESETQPAEEGREGEGMRERPRQWGASSVLGWALVIIGAFLVVRNVWPHTFWWIGGNFWPLVLILIGIAVLVSSTRKR